MKRRWISAIAVVFLWMGVACAQGVTFGGLTMTGSWRGVPFSADKVEETVRVLQDGNHIRQVRNGKDFRDAEGRTRHESSMNFNGSEEWKRVEIHDPVEQVYINFTVRDSQQAKIANVHHFRPPTPQLPVTAKTTTTSKPAGTPAKAPDQPCYVEPGREDLGTRVIEGFTVTGTKRTHTIEAGKVGNDKPIVVVEESWYSEELHEVLLSERDDPQDGHRTMKLVNIQRGEQDLALFQVPPDYTVKDDGAQ